MRRSVIYWCTLLFFYQSHSHKTVGASLENTGNGYNDVIDKKNQCHCNEICKELPALIWEAHHEERIPRKLQYRLGKTIKAICPEVNEIHYPNAGEVQGTNLIENSNERHWKEEKAFPKSQEVEEKSLIGEAFVSSYWIQSRQNQTANVQHPERKSKDEMEVSSILGELDIDEKKLVHELPKEFLSMALGSKLIDDNYKNLQQELRRFLNLASALSPSYLRVGGSRANFLMFDPSRRNDFTKTSEKRDRLPSEESGFEKEICEKQLHDDFTNFTMTGIQWDFLTGIVRRLGWTMLFDLNQFTRGPNDTWDSANAQLIFSDPATHSIPIIWELGNEPNAYAHKFGWSITPSQSAKDYSELQKLVENHFKPINNILLVGPDVTRPRKFGNEKVGEDSMEFLSGFLKKANGIIDVVSFHHFYLNGRTTTVDEFLSMDVMNIFPRQLAEMVSMRDTYAPGKPVWLTETAIAFGGGAPELSERFAATFLWLDKLGSAALGGISMVFRQALFGGCYGIIDKDLNPTPNYWISMLHKQLVGEKVLLARAHMVPETIRVYAHCLRKTHELYKKGAIVIFGLNLGEKTVSLRLFNKNLSSSSIYHYGLSAPFNDMISEHIKLNGKILRPRRNGKIPKLIPKILSDKDLVLSPKSLGFYVIPKAKHQACE